MPKDPTNSSGIFASNLLNGLGNARTLDGLTSDQFMRADANTAPLVDDSIDLGTELQRFKNIWTLNINGVGIDIFSRKNASNIPTLNNTFSLGDATHKWKQIFTTEIHADNLSTTNGDIAEKYTAASGKYPTGTVFSVSSGDYEVEVCNEECSNKVIGVVSHTGAVILSKEIEGVTLGIKGKVLIRVIGSVKKGDLLTTYYNGTACVTKNPSHKFAVALESSDIVEEKLIKAVL